MEDVVESQKEDLNNKNTKKEEYKQRINDIDMQIKKEKRTWKFFKKSFLKIILGLPPFFCFASIFSKWIIGEVVNINSHMFIEALIIGGIMDEIVLAYSTFIICSRDFCLSQIKQLKNKKIEIEELVNSLDKEISCLKKVLLKNEEYLNHLLKQQEKSNIQNMHFEVQEVPYQEALEKQKAILTQMKCQTSYKEEQLQESANPEDMILGRFRKKIEN